MLQNKGTDESFASMNVLLSSLKSLDMDGSLTMLQGFAFDNLESLSFRCQDLRFPSLKPTSLPNTLFELTLGHISFNIRPKPSHQPHSLPNLTALRLRDVRICGPLQRYLSIPNLRKLSLSGVKFCSLNNSTRNSTGRRDNSSAKLDSGRLFFRDIQTLESLRLRAMPVTNTLVGILHNLPILHTLEVEHCRMENFIRPLIEKLQDKDSFPSLSTLRIMHSWGLDPYMSYPSFVEHCAATRPDMNVLGNEERRSLYPIL
jgi:hypothetical protein